MGLFSPSSTPTYDGQQAGTTSGGTVGAPIYWRPSSNDQIVYKYPFDNLKNGAQVIVHQTQRAFLFLNGAIAHAIPATGAPQQLTTANIPMLGGFLNSATSGRTANTAEIWFVNVECERSALWGMGDLPIYDHDLEAEFIIGARGGYNLKINDAELFITKLVGTLHSFSTDDVVKFFSKKVISIITESVSTSVENNKLSIVDLQRQRSKIESQIEIDVNENLAIYGVKILNFALEGYNIPEEYKHILSEQTRGLAERKRLDKLGVDYSKERQLDIMQSAAANEGGASGTMLNAGMGMAMGVGMGGAMAGQMAGTMNSSMAPTMPPPPPPQALYHVMINNQQVGPISIAQIQGYIAQGTIDQNTLCWKPGLANWITIAQDPQLMATTTQTPPPPPLPQI